MIRAALPDDCVVLARLHRTCLRQDWQEEEFRTWLARSNYRLLVAEEERSITGYVIARVIAPEVEIIALGVEPSHRRQGIARRLMKHVLEEEGIGSCFLEVATTNAVARALYTVLGFEETGLRKAYYADGSDAVTMTANIGNA